MTNETTPDARNIMGEIELEKQVQQLFYEVGGLGEDPYPRIKKMAALIQSREAAAYERGAKDMAEKVKKQAHETLPRGEVYPEHINWFVDATLTKLIEGGK